MDMKRAGVSVELGDRAVSDGRDGNARHSGDGWPDQVIEVGNLRLHVGRLQADAGGGPVPLTRLEFLFLRELMQHAGEPLSKGRLDRKSTRLNSSHPSISYAVFCLKKKKKTRQEKSTNYPRLDTH